MSRFTNRIVLCVDDDDDDSDIICHVIKEIDSSIKVVLAPNGREGYKLLEEAKITKEIPCLILLDLNMPVMNGVETCIEIKKDPDLSKIPLAIFSTHINDMDKDFFNSHHVDMVTKPNNFREIRKEVERLLMYCNRD